jgi:uncharacterized membrane protein
VNHSRTLEVNHRWQLAFFILAHILIFALIFHTIYKIQFSATGIYFDFASKVLHGELPYKDFALEYPPFSLFFFLLPRLFASTWLTFAVYFQVEVVIVDIIGLLLIYSIARRLGRSPYLWLSIYTVGILVMGPIVGQQYDIFPAVMSLAAVYFFWRGYHKTAWALVALGALTKIYPAVIAPIFLIYYLRNREYRQIWTGVITFAAVILIILLPFLVIAPASLWTLYSYHGQRGLQLESIYSAFLMAGDKSAVATGFSYGSWNLTGATADAIAKLSTYITGVFLLISYWFMYSLTKKGRPNILQVGTFSLLAVLVTLITSKVLSPQYIIWLVPLLPLCAGRWRFAIWPIFGVIGILTFYIFPVHYNELIYLESWAVRVLLIRDALLIVMTVLVGWSMLRPVKDEVKLES